MDDEKIKQVGELLSNDASRKILKLLFKNTKTANDISKETEISLPLVMYHLKKMQEANMIRVTNVGKTVDSKDVKRYTTTKFAILIVADSVKEKVKESKSIKRSFSGLYKFASIGIATGAAWFGSMFAQQKEVPVGAPTAQFTQESTREFADVPTEEAVPSMAEDAGVEVPFEESATEVAEPSFAPPIPETVTKTVPEAVTETFPGDILISTVIALGVLVIGLIIERAVRSRRK